jgi:hypothetical protein
MGDIKKSSTKVILVLVSGILIGLLLGGYVGARLGMSFILNNSLYKNASDVQWQVDTLRQLRAGEMAQAMESIESHLDDDLILFDPEKPYADITDRVATGIDKAIATARDYRAAYPRTSDRPHVDAMVTNLFSKKGSME